VVRRYDRCAANRRQRNQRPYRDRRPAGALGDPTKSAPVQLVASKFGNFAMLAAIRFVFGSAIKGGGKRGAGIPQLTNR